MLEEIISSTYSKNYTFPNNSLSAFNYNLIFITFSVQKLSCDKHFIYFLDFSLFIIYIGIFYSKIHLASPG